MEASNKLEKIEPVLNHQLTTKNSAANPALRALKQVIKECTVFK